MKSQSFEGGDLIDEIHSRWRGQYSLLERHHGYIQWLFPLFRNNGYAATPSCVWYLR